VVTQTLPDDLLGGKAKHVQSVVLHFIGVHTPRDSASPQQGASSKHNAAKQGRARWGGAQWPLRHYYCWMDVLVPADRRGLPSDVEGCAGGQVARLLHERLRQSPRAARAPRGARLQRGGAALGGVAQQPPGAHVEVDEGDVWARVSSRMVRVQVQAWVGVSQEAQVQASEKL
jgi:hypothetical protein